MGDDVLTAFSKPTRQGMNKKKMLPDENERGEVRTKPENPLPKIAPGTVCAQMVRCGKPNCRCARGELHGPYFYHFERVNGALVKRYVKANDVARMRAACEERQRQDKRQRLKLKMNFSALVEAVERLRDYERQLLQSMEVGHGQANEEG